MRFPKSKGQTAPTAMPGEFSPWLLLLAASLGWKQAMLWQQAMISKGFQEKCPQEQDLHWLRHRIEGWQWLSTALDTKSEDFQGSFLQALFGWSNCFLEHHAQKFSIMLANLINFNIQVLLGIQTSHLCFQTFAKVLNRSSVLSSSHLEKSTADAMHKHYMQEIKTPKGDLASP